MISFLGCGPGDSGITEGDINAIAMTRDAYLNAENAGDWAAASALFTEDAAFMPPGRAAIIGRDSIQAWMEGAPMVEGLSLAPESTAGSGGVAIEHGTYAYQYLGKQKGNYLMGLKEQNDGRWLLSALMWGPVESPLELQRALDLVQYGEELYMANCATCHGALADGEGDLAELLTLKPTDLTQLSTFNDGVFPQEQVYLTVDGRSDVSAHGSREMPVWGNVWSRSTPESGITEELVLRRANSLVAYLESIQDD